MCRERRDFQGAAGDGVSNTAQPTKGKEIMGKRIEDLKEKAPCGMLIHYTVNEEDILELQKYRILQKNGQKANSLAVKNFWIKWKRFKR